MNLLKFHKLGANFLGATLQVEKQHVTWQAYSEIENDLVMSQSVFLQLFFSSHSFFSSAFRKEIDLAKPHNNNNNNNKKSLVS